MLVRGTGTHHQNPQEAVLFEPKESPKSLMMPGDYWRALQSRWNAHCHQVLFWTEEQRLDLAVSAMETCGEVPRLLWLISLTFD